MKKILICGLVLLSVFIIYLANMDREVYYLTLGDSNKTSLDSYDNEVNGYSFYVKDYLNSKGVLEKYVYGYSNRDDRITDLIYDIENNKRLKDNTLKNALIKADLVTISINPKDIFDKLVDDTVIYSELYDYIDELALDLEKLLSIIRKYCKEDIIFIGYYNPYKYMSNIDIDDVIEYLNKSYKEICKKYNVEYVDVTHIEDECLPNKKSFNLSKKGYKVLASKIIEIIDKKLFEG